MTDTDATPQRDADTATQPGDLHWDPFDPDLKHDPYPVWRRLREEAPCYYNKEFDFWALSRFDDVDAAHRDPSTFSSAHGIILERMSPIPMDTGMMISRDPPEHTRLRRLASRAFTAPRVIQLEDEIRSVCRSLLDPHRGERGFDFVQDFGAKLPAKVIAALLGVPETDREQVRHDIDRCFHLEPGAGMINDVSITAMAAVYGYIREQLVERNLRPRDDMLSDLVRAEITDDEGATRQLTLEESTDFGILLIMAGTETVARLIGWAGWVLERASRSAGRACGRSYADPQRGGGATALRGAVHSSGPVDHLRRRSPWSAYSSRFQGALAHRGCRPRRASLP